MNTVGDKVVIGADRDDATGVDAGHVRVYGYSSDWSQLGWDLDGEAASDYFGASVAINGAGDRVAVGAIYNDGGPGSNAGHVRVFESPSICPLPLAITISSEEDPTFSYGTLGFCSADSDPTPTISGTSGGVFSSTSGLVINASTGVIDLSGSTPGTYGVTYTTAGSTANACVGSLTKQIKVSATTADFNYGGSTTFCNNESNPVATITGVVDGEFSSSTGLALDAVTGAINLNGSVAGSYDVSYSPPLNFAQMGVDLDGYTNDDRFGTSVALNKAGDVMVVGAQLNDASGTNAGQVRVYSWNGTAWSQLGDSINGEGGDDRFGYSVSINGAGDRIVVGAHHNDAGSVVDNLNGTFSYTTPISKAGHARIYSYNNGVWTQLGSDINGDAVNDKLGISVDMNEAGDRVVVAIREDDNTVGSNAGATRIFEYQTNDWVQLGSDIFGERASDYCEAVAMNDLGNRVIIGSRYANGPNNENDRGHARVFEYVNSAWVQMGADIDAPDGNYFGHKLDMNGAGDKVVVGGYFHNHNTGRVMIYSYSVPTWSQIGSTLKV